MMPVYLRVDEPADRICSGRMALLDRDGTVVHDRHYLNDPAGLEFLPMAAEGLRRFYGLGFRLAIVSNQSGVGRGLISMAQLDAMNVRLAQMCEEIGAPLAGIFCCPHAPAQLCRCRKPEPGLVELAVSVLAFDPRSAVLIGNRESDVELGQRIGATSVYVGQASAGILDLKPSFVAADLEGAAGLFGGDGLRPCRDP